MKCKKQNDHSTKDSEMKKGFKSNIRVRESNDNIRSVHKSTTRNQPKPLNTERNASKQNRLNFSKLKDNSIDMGHVIEAPIRRSASRSGNEVYTLRQKFNEKIAAIKQNNTNFETFFQCNIDIVIINIHIVSDYLQYYR